jgi:hypothetical protein
MSVLTESVEVVKAPWSWRSIEELLTESNSSATEWHLVRTLATRLRSDWRLRRNGLEVASHGRARADICVVMKDEQNRDALIAIEAKLTDWPRALRQAALNRYVADASFVALPNQFINPSLIRHALELGVGVLGVGDRSLVIVVKALTSNPDANIRSRVIAQLPTVRGRGQTEFRALVRGRSNE